MQSLHLVGFTEGREGLILSDGRGPREQRYVVPVDDALLELLRSEAPAPAGGVLRGSTGT